jgi:hypothetical protein
VIRPTVKPGTPPDFILKVTIDRHPVRFFVHKRPHVDFFLNVVSRMFATVRRGQYFGPKTIFIPPASSENDIFFSSPDMSIFNSHCGFLVLILSSFAFIGPLYFSFSRFLSLFFLFLLHFPPFSLPLFIFFPPNYIG